MSNVEKKTLYLLMTVFPSLLDLYYTHPGEIRFQITNLLRAGYYKYVNDLQKDEFQKYSLLLIENIKTWKLTELEVILIIDSFCDEYLDFVKKERRLLWIQLKQLVESNDVFIKFNTEYNEKSTDEHLNILTQADNYFNSINCIDY